MRELPEGMAEALVGSGEARIQFDVWYDGNLLIEDLPVGGWSQKFDRGQAIVGSTQVTALDEDGSLTPWGMDDALGVGGARLHSRLFVGDYSVNLTEQRITESEPEETWRLTEDGLVWLPGSSTIPVTAEDLTVMAVGSKFIASETPASGGTCISEIQRLLTGIMDVVWDDGLDAKDKTVPTDVVYKDERMDAVTDLVEAMGLSARVNSSGQFHLYDPTDETIKKTIVGGELGSLIRVKRKQKIDGLNNAVRSFNTTPSGVEMAQIAYETNGALAWDGPHGRWPKKRQANFAGSETTLLEDAKAELARTLASRGVRIPVRTTLDPSLEVGDWVEIMAPTPTGEATPLRGSIESISYGGQGGVPVAMDIEVACRMSDIQTASDKIRRHRWLGI
ncbi:minor tail protein [Arthrobacter phage Ottawa]|nr:minor tail protein [Arthrobacter phage Kharcho]WIC89277.1 minor tail protein [Arthrobacter phage Ottawa]